MLSPNELAAPLIVRVSEPTLKDAILLDVSAGSADTLQGRQAELLRAVRLHLKNIQPPVVDRGTSVPVRLPEKLLEPNTSGGGYEHEDPAQ